MRDLPRQQEMVGFATSGPARDDSAPAPTELWSLNVVPRHHGSGVALDLMTAVLGDTGNPAYLWVARDNARAVAFYRKHGFGLDGVTRYDPGWDCHEVRMTTTSVRAASSSTHRRGGGRCRAIPDDPSAGLIEDI